MTIRRPLAMMRTAFESALEHNSKSCDRKTDEIDNDRTDSNNKLQVVPIHRIGLQIPRHAE